MDANWMKIARMTEEEAREQLEAIRWPDGIVCPKCGSDKGAWKMKTERAGLYKCRACTRKFTVTMGTIFEDSHIPLNKWLMGVFLMNSSKKGISAHQLHRMLGITYKAAWFMAHRIRFAMTEGPISDLMHGEVELDATYVGGKERFKHADKRIEDARGSVGKTPVFALVERGGDLHAGKMTNLTNYNIRDEVRKYVHPDATLLTDEANAYDMLYKEYPNHAIVNHMRREYVRGNVHTNTLEGWFALLKRGVIGTFHHVSEQHLDRYVNEFAFRYNNRKITDAERATKAIRAIEGKRLIYKEAINKGCG